MLVIVSVRVSVPVTTVTNPSPLAAGVVVASTASFRPAPLVTVKLGLIDWELVRPGTRVEEASMELTGKPAVLLKVLKVLLGRSNTASSMQPLHAPGMYPGTARIANTGAQSLQS